MILIIYQDKNTMTLHSITFVSLPLHDVVLLLSGELKLACMRCAPRVWCVKFHETDH